MTIWNSEMSNSRNLPTARGLGWLMSGRFGRGVALAPEDGSGSGGGVGDGTTEPDPKTEETPKGAGEGKNEPNISDKEAELLKEVMDKKAKLKETAQEVDRLKAELTKFSGIDLNEVKKLLDDRKAAEKAALEAKGDFERLKAMMAEEHQKELSTLTEKLTERERALQDSMTAINDLTVGTAFRDSAFVKDELVLTAAKARTVYGAHFEVEAGQVVAYDKPRGSEGRTKLVNGSGDPLGFEDAIRKLVDADPDRDQLVRSKMKPGASSKTTDEKPKETATEVKGLGRIMAALETKTSGKK